MTAFGLFGKNKFMPPNIAFMELFKFCKELSSVFNATEGPSYVLRQSFYTARHIKNDMRDVFFLSFS